MLKTHVLLHRLLLDSGEEFRTQIMKMHKWVVEDRNTDSTLKCLFSIRAWKDETSMEVSGWCRTYASYLDEFVANWEDFSDFARINKNPTGSETQMRSLPADELVRKLPICQLMMRRIIDCEAINDSLTANEVVIAATRLLFRGLVQVVPHVQRRRHQAHRPLLRHEQAPRRQGARDVQEGDGAR